VAWEKNYPQHQTVKAGLPTGALAPTISVVGIKRAWAAGTHLEMRLAAPNRQWKWHLLSHSHTAAARGDGGADGDRLIAGNAGRTGAGSK